MALVAEKPSMTGICKSINTTSNVRRRVSVTASLPFCAMVTSCPRRVEQTGRDSLIDPVVFDHEDARTLVRPAVIAIAPVVVLTAPVAAASGTRPNARSIAVYSSAA